MHCHKSIACLPLIHSTAPPLCLWVSDFHPHRPSFCFPVTCILWPFFCPHLPFTTFLIPFLVSVLRPHSPLSFLFCRLSLPSGDPYLCYAQLSLSVSFTISWDSFLFHSCSHMFSSTVCWRGCLLCNTCFWNFENIDIFSCLYFWCFCSSPLI